MQRINELYVRGRTVVETKGILNVAAGMPQFRQAWLVCLSALQLAACEDIAFTSTQPGRAKHKTSYIVASGVNVV